MAKTVLRKNAEFLRVPRLDDILPCCVLFLAGRAQLLGTFPFGTAFFCACFDKSTAYLGITVLYISLISAGAGGTAVKYMLAAMTFWLFGKLFGRRSSPTEAAVCAASLLMSGLSFLLYGEFSVYNVALAGAEAVVGGVSFAVFSDANALVSIPARRAPSQAELISLAAAVSVVIGGMQGFSFPYGISISRTAAVLCAMLAAKHTGVGSAAAMGLCVGFVTGVPSQYAMVLSGTMGICAAAAGFLKGFGRFGIILGFIGAAAAVLLCVPLYMTELEVSDVLIAAALFALIPNRLHKRIAVYFNAAASDGMNISRAKTYMQRKLEDFGCAFDSLESAFMNISDKHSDGYEFSAEKMIDKTAARVCVGCGRAERCWNIEFEKTCSAVVSLFDTLERDGRLCSENAPVRFRDRCCRADEFTAEFNHVYELEKAEMLRLGDAARSRDLSARQYAQISRAFKRLAAQINKGFDFCPNEEEKLAAALDRAGIACAEISAVQSEIGNYEVFLKTDTPFRADILENIVSETLECGMKITSGNGQSVRLMSKPIFDAEFGTSSRAASAENGDSLCTFMNGNREFYAIISDGMGSGREAGEESRMSVDLLRTFLSAGFSAASAIDILNSALCLKLERESFATVDLLRIDLMSGTAEFFKTGAAASVIYRSGETRSVYSVSLPAGMVEETDTMPQKFRLEDGDVIVMVSDGVTDAPLVHTEWIKNRIRSDCGNMNALAESIVSTAIEKGGGEVRDDMSVIAIKIAEVF